MAGEGRTVNICGFCNCYCALLLGLTIACSLLTQIFVKDLFIFNVPCVVISLLVVLQLVVVLKLCLILYFYLRFSFRAWESSPNNILFFCLILFMPILWNIDLWNWNIHRSLPHRQFHQSRGLGCKLQRRPPGWWKAWVPGHVDRIQTVLHIDPSLRSRECLLRLARGQGVPLDPEPRGRTDPYINSRWWCYVVHTQRLCDLCWWLLDPGWDHPILDIRVSSCLLPSLILLRVGGVGRHHLGEKCVEPIPILRGYFRYGVCNLLCSKHPCVEHNQRRICAFVPRWCHCGVLEAAQES